MTGRQAAGDVSVLLFFVTVDVSCNFETSLCGWSSAGQLVHSLGTDRADLQWTVLSRQLSSVFAGPAADHSSTDASQCTAVVLRAQVDTVRHTACDSYSVHGCVSGTVALQLHRKYRMTQKQGHYV